MGYNLTPQNVGRYGLALGQGRSTKLYPYELLMEEVLVADEFEGQDVIVLYDPDTESARAFQSGGHTFTWSKGKLKDERGVLWNAAKGTSSLDGEKPLVRLPATTWLQHRWERFYPEGEIFEL